MTANEISFIKKLVKIILAVMKVCTVAIIESCTRDVPETDTEKKLAKINKENSMCKVDSIFEDAIEQIDRI